MICYVKHSLEKRIASIFQLLHNFPDASVQALCNLALFVMWETVEGIAQVTVYDVHHRRVVRPVSLRIAACWTRSVVAKIPF